MPLDGPLLPADWTAEINYLANTDGSMTMSLVDGPKIKVPVHPGLNRVFVRLPGAGDAITVRANTAALIAVHRLRPRRVRRARLAPQRAQMPPWTRRSRWHRHARSLGKGEPQKVEPPRRIELLTCSLRVSRSTD